MLRCEDVCGGMLRLRSDQPQALRSAGGKGVAAGHRSDQERARPHCSADGYEPTRQVVHGVEGADGDGQVVGGHRRRPIVLDYLRSVCCLGKERTGIDDIYARHYSQHAIAPASIGTTDEERMIEPLLHQLPAVRDNRQMHARAGTARVQSAPRGRAVGHEAACRREPPFAALVRWRARSDNSECPFPIENGRALGPPFCPDRGGCAGCGTIIAEVP